MNRNVMVTCALTGAGDTVGRSELVDTPAMYQLCMGIPYGAPAEEREILALTPR